MLSIIAEIENGYADTRVTGRTDDLVEVLIGDSIDVIPILLGSVDVVDTNLACVYPDHLIDLQK
jgi:hypothetical protein